MNRLWPWNGLFFSIQLCVGLQRHAPPRFWLSPAPWFQRKPARGSCLTVLTRCGTSPAAPRVPSGQQFMALWASPVEAREA